MLISLEPFRQWSPSTINLSSTSINIRHLKSVSLKTHTFLHHVLHHLPYISFSWCSLSDSLRRLVDTSLYTSIVVLISVWPMIDWITLILHSFSHRREQKVCRIWWLEKCGMITGFLSFERRECSLQAILMRSIARFTFCLFINRCTIFV